MLGQPNLAQYQTTTQPVWQQQPQQQSPTLNQQQILLVQTQGGQSFITPAVHQPTQATIQQQQVNGQQQQLLSPMNVTIKPNANGLSASAAKVVTYPTVAPSSNITVAPVPQKLHIVTGIGASQANNNQPTTPTNKQRTIRPNSTQGTQTPPGVSQTNSVTGTSILVKTTTSSTQLTKLAPKITTTSTILPVNQISKNVQSGPNKLENRSSTSTSTSPSKQTNQGSQTNPSTSSSTSTINTNATAETTKVTTSTSTNKAMNANTNVMIPEKSAITTHLIDGFLIEESNTPFPVDRLVLRSLNQARKSTASTGNQSSSTSVGTNSDKTMCVACKKRPRMKKRNSEKLARYCSMACSRELKKMSNTKSSEAGAIAATTATSFQQTLTAEAQTATTNSQPQGLKKVLSPKKQLPPMANFVAPTSASDSVGANLMLPPKSQTMVNSNINSALLTKPTTSMVNNSQTPTMVTGTYTRIQPVQQQQKILMNNGTAILQSGYPATYIPNQIRVQNNATFAPMVTMQTMSAPIQTTLQVRSAVSGTGTSTSTSPSHSNGIKTSPTIISKSVAPSMLNGLKRPSQVYINGVLSNATSTPSSVAPGYQMSPDSSDKRQRTNSPLYVSLSYFLISI